MSAHLDTADLSFINDCKCDHIKHDMKCEARCNEQERVACRRIVLLTNPNIFVLCRASDMKIIPPALLIKTSNNWERGQTVERVKSGLQLAQCILDIILLFNYAFQHTRDWRLWSLSKVLYIKHWNMCHQNNVTRPMLLMHCWVTRKLDDSDIQIVFGNVYVRETR